MFVASDFFKSFRGRLVGEDRKFLTALFAKDWSWIDQYIVVTDRLQLLKREIRCVIFYVFDIVGIQDYFPGSSTPLLPVLSQRTFPVIALATGGLGPVSRLFIMPSDVISQPQQTSGSLLALFGAHMICLATLPGRTIAQGRENVTMEHQDTLWVKVYIIPTPPSESRQLFVEFDFWNAKVHGASFRES